MDWEVLWPEEKRRRASLEPTFKWLAVIMDGLLRIPGSKRRLGLNPLIDLIPVVGDVSAAFVFSSASSIFSLRSKIGVRHIHNPAGHISPVRLFPLAHALRETGFERVEPSTDAYQRRSWLAFIPLYLPMKIARAFFGAANETSCARSRRAIATSSPP